MESVEPVHVDQEFLGDTLEYPPTGGGGDVPDMSVDHDEYRAWVVRRRAARSGYDPSDLAWYSIGALERLVEACVGGFTPMPEMSATRSTGDPAEGGNIHAALADVQRGLYKLMSPEHRAVLLLHYSGYLEASYDTLQAALRDLQDQLGGSRPRGL